MFKFLQNNSKKFSSEKAADEDLGILFVHQVHATPVA